MENRETWLVNSDRRPYATPKLVKYGAVRSLTQAANSGSMEGSSSDMPNMAMSDRRVKKNIFRIGNHPLGIGLYLFDYKPQFRDTFGQGRQFGVLADEVEQVLPEAVSVHVNGYKSVDYAMLGISRHIH